jgi:hypothetical protein
MKRKVTLKSNESQHSFRSEFLLKPFSRFIERPIANDLLYKGKCSHVIFFCSQILMEIELTLTQTFQC